MMFSFRQDKTGFFVTIILLVIATGTAISASILVVVGMAHGNWLEYLLSIKWIFGSAWVACIITVLIRLRIYKWQYDRGQDRKRAEEESTDGEQKSDATETPG